MSKVRDLEVISRRHLRGGRSARVLVRREAEVLPGLTGLLVPTVTEVLVVIDPRNGLYEDAQRVYLATAQDVRWLADTLSEAAQAWEGGEGA